MAMFRDVYPVHQEVLSDDEDQVVQAVLKKLWNAGKLVEGDRVLVTMGDRMGKSGGTNTMRFIKLDADGRAHYAV